MSRSIKRYGHEVVAILKEKKDNAQYKGKSLADMIKKISANENFQQKNDLMVSGLRIQKSIKAQKLSEINFKLNDSDYVIKKRNRNNSKTAYNKSNYYYSVPVSSHMLKQMKRAINLDSAKHRESEKDTPLTQTDLNRGYNDFIAKLCLLNIDLLASDKKDNSKRIVLLRNYVKKAKNQIINSVELRSVLLRLQHEALKDEGMLIPSIPRIHYTDYKHTTTIN